MSEANSMRHESDYMRVAVGSMNRDDWQIVVKKAVEDAKNGDAQARQWLSKYLGLDNREGAKNEQGQ